MNFRRSKYTVAATGFALACAMACNGGEEKPVQDATYLTFGQDGGSGVAFGYSADKGLHFAAIDGASTVHMAVKSQVTGREQSTGGTSFFSGSTGGSSSFSGSTGGNASFSGTVGGNASFNGELAGAGAFAGTTILNGAACDLVGICDFFTLLCNSEGVDCQGFDAAQCRATVSDPAVQAQVEAALADEDLVGAFCALVNFIGCIGRGATSFDAVSDALAQQCASSSGLVNVFQQSSQF